MAPNLDKFCHRFCLQCACNDCKNGDHLGGAILSCVPGPPQEAQFWLIWIIIVSWSRRRRRKDFDLAILGSRNAHTGLDRGWHLREKKTTFPAKLNQLKFGALNLWVVFVKWDKGPEISKGREECLCTTNIHYQFKILIIQIRVPPALAKPRCAAPAFREDFFDHIIGSGQLID